MRIHLFHVVLGALSLLAAEDIRKMGETISVPGADEISPIVPSPLDHTVAGFAIAPIDGEITYGTPFVVMKSVGNAHVSRLTKRTIDTEGLVWSSIAPSLYTSTPHGIYVWRLRERPKLVRRGETTGLAVSPDDRLLAFWDFSTESSENNFELAVININSRKELRRWELGTRYAKDKHGFELLFGKNSDVIYARTFESEDARPLKAFEISSGKTATLSENSVCLAETADGVFYLEGRGRYEGSNRQSLFRMTDWNRSELLQSDIPAAVCGGNRGGHLLVTVEKGQVWSYDTSQKRFTSFPTRCDRAAAFSDGSLVFAHKNRLFWGKCR